MKIHTVAAAVFAATFMLLESGCIFSALNRSAGSKPTAYSTVVSAAADVVTAPVQAPWIAYGIIAGPGQERAREAYEARKAAALEAIKKDPAVVLGWDLSTKVPDGKTMPPEMSAVRDALHDKTPGFTDSLLREIARRSPTLRPVVFLHPAASAACFRESFDEAMADAAHDQTTIEFMIRSPNMPDDLLLAVIQRLPGLRWNVFYYHSVPESFIRAAFEEEMIKESRAKPGTSISGSVALPSMIRNLSMPDDLMFEVIRREPKLRAMVFSAASESFLRVAFDEELLKESQSQPSAILSMLYNPHMPDDLLLRIIVAKLPNRTYENWARQELQKRAAAKRPTQTPASDTPPATP